MTLKEVAPLPDKYPDVISLVRKCLLDGRFLDTRHAKERQTERSITRYEIVHVLESGFHEKRKDQFKKEFGTWNYAIRGKTLERKDLRIVVSFDQETSLLIITAIEILKGEK